MSITSAKPSVPRSRRTADRQVLLESEAHTRPSDEVHPIGGGDGSSAEPTSRSSSSPLARKSSRSIA